MRPLAVGQRYRPELGRKVIHLATGALPVMYARGASRSLLILLLGVASLLALAVELARRRWPGAETMFERAVGAMLRRHEQRAVTGATWLALATLAAVVLLPKKPAIVVLWCSCVADPVATITGRAWSRESLAGAGKTWRGSAACMVVAFAGSWSIAGVTPGAALVIAGAAMLAERFPGPFDDNLTVSVGVGMVAAMVA